MFLQILNAPLRFDSGQALTSLKQPDVPNHPGLLIQPVGLELLTADDAEIGVYFAKTFPMIV